MVTQPGGCPIRRPSASGRSGAGRSRPASRGPPLRRLEWSETKNIRWKVEIPGRGSSSPVDLGRSAVRAVGRADRASTGRGAHAPRGGVRPRDRYRFVVLAIDRRTGKTIWERTAREEQPHEAIASGQRHLRVELGDHRRHARLRLVRVAGHVRLRHGRQRCSGQKDLGDKTMRNQFGEGSTPVLSGDRLVIVWDHLGGSRSSSRSTRASGRRAVAREPRTRSTPGRRRSSSSTSGRRAGDRAGDEQDPQLRPRDRPASSGKATGVTMNPIPSPVLRRRHGVRHERLPGQQPQGDPPRRRAGRHHRHRRDRVDARSRHAVRAVAAALRRHPLPAEDQLRDPLGVRREDRQAALPAAAPRRRAEVFASPVGAQRPRLHRRRATASTLRHPARAGRYELLAKNKLDDGFDASPALVDDAIYLRGYRNLTPSQEIDQWNNYNSDSELRSTHATRGLARTLNSRTQTLERLALVVGPERRATRARPSGCRDRGSRG